MVLRRIVVTPFVENVYIIGSKKTRECIVIDPGAEPNRILYEVEQLGLVVKLIANTHGHADHTSGVAGIKMATGALYAIHKADVPLLRVNVPWITQSVTDYQPPPYPDMFLSDQAVLKIGSLEFKVLETPGHTPGGVCLYGYGLLFTGDTLFHRTIGRYDLEGGDGWQLLRSIHAKLLTLPSETVVLPGHGEQSTIGIEQNSNPFLQGKLDELT